MISYKRKKYGGTKGIKKILTNELKRNLTRKERYKLFI